jgi:uncharacterized Fe-S radical SAM superfamily protein PflX
MDLVNIIKFHSNNSENNATMNLMNQQEPHPQVEPEDADEILEITRQTMRKKRPEQLALEKLLAERDREYALKKKAEEYSNKGRKTDT